MEAKAPKFTIVDFNKMFPDEDTCLDYVRDMVYPDGITCRKCAVVRPHSKIEGRKAYACAHCGTHVYPLAGTIFEKSSTALKSWFYAMYLMASTRSGISAKQLERELGVTYKTAWRMFRQIRELLAEDSGPLRGTVEVDETFIGGKPRYGKNDDRPRDEYGRIKRGPRPKSHPKQNIAVIGAVERGGQIRAMTVPNRRAENVLPLIAAHVMPDATVFTDDANVYRKLGKQGYQHKRINHSARVYVEGDVHTNTIEGFWSLLKNGIRGVYHSVGANYLQTYVDEYTFRYNHRRGPDTMFDAISGRVAKVRSGKLGEYAPVGE